MERFVEVSCTTRLWAQERGDGPPLLLLMGAGASGLGWPEGLVDRLAARHRVIRYDHRDTGASTWAFDQEPYAVPRLAEDAIAVLDGFGVDRAHVVGMSLGGLLAQLLLLDHLDRLLSVTLLATGALSGGPPESEATLTGPRREVLAFWEGMGAERSVEEETAWREEHMRLINGGGVPYDDTALRELVARDIAHAGTHRQSTAHARAEPSGLDRGAELATTTVPTLVIETPEDPVYPPPHASHLAATVAGARLVTIPGMGHAIPPAVVDPLAEAILAHTGAH